MQITWKLAAAIMFMPAALLAQSTFGTILGTVTDSSGAVVPQAKITITNQGENISHATLTDSQGNYEALNLKAGVYTVAAEAAGFSGNISRSVSSGANASVACFDSTAPGRVNI